MSPARTAGLDLLKGIKNVGLEEWPGLIAKMFIDPSTPDQVLASATSVDEKCEGNYFVAEWHLANGDREGAIKTSRRTHNRRTGHKALHLRRGKVARRTEPGEHLV
jgi:hypothetical protein